MLKKKYSMYNVDTSVKGKKKRTLDGCCYDSRTEMLFVIEWIQPKMESGELISWERQVPYLLQDGFIDYHGKKNLPIKYIADFKCITNEGHEIVIDVKGMPDAIAKIKKKLFMYKYPNVDYRWYCRNIKRGGWLLWDDLEKLKREEKKKTKTFK